MKKIVSLLCVTAMAVASLAGCGGGGSAAETSAAAGTAAQTAAAGGTAESSGEKVFSIAIDYMPERLIPNHGTDSVTVMTQAIYDPLFYDTLDGFIPKLADSLDISEDGLTYTVHLN
ncbi:MAG: hypothetical protein Q4C63_03340 [Eubacteriales bacterium]|nr:hypothetical protein [Eubacteriales bacterium]